MTPAALADRSLIQWLAAHWELLLLAALLLGVGIVAFRATFAVYDQIFFAGRAVRNAFCKTALMVALLWAIFAVPYWVAQVLLPPGWTRSLSFIVSLLLFNMLWGKAGRLLDRLFIGR